MGKLQQFDITFTNNKVVYGPGESVSGTVKIRTANSLQFKGKLPGSSSSLETSQHLWCQRFFAAAGLGVNKLSPHARKGRMCTIAWFHVSRLVLRHLGGGGAASWGERAGLWLRRFSHLVRLGRRVRLKATSWSTSCLSLPSIFV